MVSVCLLMFVGLVLRLLHWNSFSQYPWFDFLGLDSKYYDEWAQKILRDGVQGEEPYFMGPLYPHLLAIGYKMFVVWFNYVPEATPAAAPPQETGHD